MTQLRKYIRYGIYYNRRKIGIDATKFFNYLSGYTVKPEYYNLFVSPSDIRDEFLVFDR